MAADGTGNFEVFLVEDMILTLLNLKGSLGWLAGESLARDPEGRRSAQRRLEAQIDMLEERARDLVAGLKDSRAAGAGGCCCTCADDAGANMFRDLWSGAEAGAGPDETDGAGAGAVVFRTRRVA